MEGKALAHRRTGNGDTGLTPRSMSLTRCFTLRKAWRTVGSVKYLYIRRCASSGSSTLEDCKFGLALKLTCRENAALTPTSDNENLQAVRLSALQLSSPCPPFRASCLRDRRVKTLFHLGATSMIATVLSLRPAQDQNKIAWTYVRNRFGNKGVIQL